MAWRVNEWLNYTPHSPDDLRVRQVCHFWGPPEPRTGLPVRFSPHPEPWTGPGSGSAHILNLGPDLGPVRPGSGPNLGSEPDCGITSFQERTCFADAEIRHNASIRCKEWCYYCKGTWKGRVSTDANSGVVKASTTRVVS